jgi:hypothetical protein
MQQPGHVRDEFQLKQILPEGAPGWEGPRVRRAIGCFPWRPVIFGRRRSVEGVVYSSVTQPSEALLTSRMYLAKVPRFAL